MTASASVAPSRTADAVTVVVLLGTIAARGTTASALVAVAVALVAAIVIAVVARRAVAVRHHLVDLAAIAVATAVAVPSEASVPVEAHGHPGDAATAPVLVGVAGLWMLARILLLRGAGDRGSQLLTLAVAGMCLVVVLLGALSPS